MGGHSQYCESHGVKRRGRAHSRDRRNPRKVAGGVFVRTTGHDRHQRERIDEDVFSEGKKVIVPISMLPQRAGLKFPSRSEEDTGTIMKQTDKRAYSVATTRAM